MDLIFIILLKIKVQRMNGNALRIMNVNHVNVIEEKMSFSNYYKYTFFTILQYKRQFSDEQTQN